MDRKGGEAMTTDERLDRLEAKLDVLIEQRTVKDWYSVDEVATRVGKASFTVREWCRRGRIEAQKRSYKRGKSAEWMISHAELVRIRNEGLREAS